MLRSAHGVVVDAAELSHPGRDPDKQVNEDSLATAEAPFGLIAVVCDGMGGHASGEVASRAAVRRILEVLTTSNQPLERLLPAAIEQAHAEVYALGGDSPIEARPGSTAVVLALSGRDAMVAHVGDSRAFRLRARKVERLTRDHSVVEALLAAGAIDQEQARAHPDANRITRALGIAPDIEPELGPPLPLEVGDVFVLCSDGLSDLVNESELADALLAAASPESACQSLVALANQRGGHDNISVQVLRVLAVVPARRARDTVELPPEDARTVVDQPVFTVVMSASENAPRDTAPDMEAARRTAPTLIDPLVAAHAAHQEHTLPSARKPPLTSIPPARGLSQQERARLLFWAAVSVCGLIFGLVALWWLLR